MLSLTELKRVVGVLETSIVGHRLQAAMQPDGTSAVLGFYGSGKKRNLLLSCSRESARVSLVSKVPRALATPPAVTQYLRAHAVGGVVREVGLLDEDRQLALRIENADGSTTLVLSILGPRSNLYILDCEGTLLAAMRPLADTRNELALGAAWHSPASRPPRAGDDRFCDVPDEELLETIEEHYRAADREVGSATLRRRIDHALAKQRKILDRKLAKLEGELDIAQASIDCERQGELLKGAISRVKKGDSEVVARDHDRDEDVRIPLDPSKTPAENLELLFKRYRKGLRTLTRGGAQLDAVRADLAAVSSEQDALGELTTREVGVGKEDFEVFSQRPLCQRLLKKFAPAAGDAAAGRSAQRRGGREPDRKLAGRTVPASLMPRRYKSAAGLEIWVGRSDAANDFLSTRLARGKDLFFHLDGAPGSHVILRTEGRDDPPSEAVLDACELAVHFSKAKKATRADVHIVPVKNVKKPRGAKPGLVTVHGGRSLHLRRIPARLERILAARIEE